MAPAAASAADPVSLAGGGSALTTGAIDTFRSVVHSTSLAGDGFTGSGVTVAIVDSGVADVPALHDRLVRQVTFANAPATGDQFGHGTFVAGLVHSVAPDARLLSVKLAGASGATDVSQVLAAVQWVVAHKEAYGIRVLNLSLGTDSKQPSQVSPLDYAVERAWDAGIVVVVSAGNGGPAAGSVTKPADDPLVVSVGSTDDAGTQELADDSVPAWTARGPVADGVAKPDVTAPGLHLVSLRAPGSSVDTEFPNARVGDDGFRGSGTSFSAAIVSGVVAQLLQRVPDATPDQVKAALMDNATLVAGDATAQGHGTIDALAASIGIGAHANAGVARSTGLGKLDAARGSARVVVRRADGSVRELNGNHTAQARPYDAREFTRSTWSAAHWGAAQWGAAQWGAAQWGAAQWGAAQWGAAQWGAAQWGAAQWGAAQWGAAQWGAAQWWAAQWG